MLWSSVALIPMHATTVLTAAELWSALPTASPAADHDCLAELAELTELVEDDPSGAVRRALLARLGGLGVAKLGQKQRVINTLRTAVMEKRAPRLTDVVFHKPQPLPCSAGSSVVATAVPGLYAKLSLAESRRMGRLSFESAQAFMHITAQVMVHCCAPAFERSFPPPRRAPRTVQLVLLVASHVGSVSRVQTLTRTLRSAAAQRGCPHFVAVMLSWSCDPSLRSAVVAAIDAMANDFGGPGGTRLHTFEVMSKCSQFEHYARLTADARRLFGTSASPERGDDGSDTRGESLEGVAAWAETKAEAEAETTSEAKAGTRAETWILFTDDDDLMHPARCAAYCRAASRAPDGVGAVAASWVARPVRDEPTLRTASDVDGLVEARRVVCTPQQTGTSGGGSGGVGGDDGGSSGTSRGAWDEYFNSAVRLSALGRFFDDACPHPLRESTYADLALYCYLRHAAGCCRFMPHASGGFEALWCHLYDKPLDLSQRQHALSSGVSSTQVDVRAPAAARSLHCRANRLHCAPPPTPFRVGPILAGRGCATTARETRRDNETGQ